MQVERVAGCLCAKRLCCGLFFPPPRLGTGSLYAEQEQRYGICGYRMLRLLCSEDEDGDEDDGDCNVESWTSPERGGGGGESLLSPPAGFLVSPSPSASKRGVRAGWVSGLCTAEPKLQAAREGSGSRSDL